jgi:carbon monoxide dehydrogenase subunit G
MARGVVEVTVTVPADVTWEIVGDFGGIAEWAPGIESFRLEGDDRIVGMSGVEVRERLLARDEEGRTITYSVVGAPIESHRATMSVKADGRGSKVTWAYEVTPDELEPILAETYRRALASLRSKLDGGS